MIAATVPREYHCRIIGTVARRKGEAGEAAQGQRTVGGIKRDFEIVATGIDIADRDRVAAAAREHQRVVLIGNLDARHIIDRRIIDRVDRYRDRIIVGQRTTSARIALIVGDDLYAGRTKVVRRRVERHAFQGCADGRDRACKYHRRVVGAVTCGEGETGDAA